MKDVNCIIVVHLQVAMNFKLLVLLTIALFHSITATPTEETYDETYMKCLSEVIFGAGPPGRSITKNLRTDQLKTMTEIPDLSGCANEELNRRSKIAFYQNGAVKPAYLGKINEIITLMNCSRWELWDRIFQHYWSPHKAIMFGNKQSMHNITAATLFDALMFVSYADHLSIVGRESCDIDHPFIFPTEMKENGSPMNGFIFPWHMRNGAGLARINMGDSASYKTYLHWNKTSVKLFIAINNEGEEQEIAKNGALAAARDVYSRTPHAVVCFVAQADKRPVKTNYEMELNSRVLVFYGDDAQSSMRVVEKNDTEETLKAKFEDWKEELTFLDSYQTVAFHLTVVNADEPENSEDLFRETFRNTPLSTFRLLDNSSTVGVLQGNSVHNRPVFALVGYPKYG